MSQYEAEWSVIVVGTEESLIFLATGEMYLAGSIEGDFHDIAPVLLLIQHGESMLVIILHSADSHMTKVLLEVFD